MQTNQYVFYTDQYSERPKVKLTRYNPKASCRFLFDLGIFVVVVVGVSVVSVFKNQP